MYFMYLRKVVGIKASFYSRIPNSTVWAQANYTTIPSQTLIVEQFQQLITTFTMTLYIMWCSPRDTSIG